MPSFPASRKSKMPKKKSTDENVEYQSAYNNQRCLLSEPITLHIMKEMEVSPLNDTLMNECILDPNVSREKMPLQTVNGKKRPELTTPEGSPSFKAFRDDFILFRKSNHSHPLGEDHFSKLSDEIILHVFQWLPKTVLVKCSQVCKRWKILSCDESLWKRYDFGKKLVKPGVLGTLLGRGVTALRLAMSEVKSPVFTDLEFSSGTRFSKLQYLDLSMSTLNDEAVASILSVCNTLKKLSLEHCPLNEDCCRFIAQNKELEVLNMCMCQGLTAAGLYAITTSCVKLKEWNLAWTNLDSTCMETFLPLLPDSLLRLNISGHRESFDDKALITIVNRCPEMIELDISDCPLVTGTSFAVLVEKCSNLEHLHTSRSYSIPTSCNRLLKDMKNFKQLEIFRTLTDEALAALRDYMPEIKINQCLFSTIARPTTGIRRTSIWGIRVRD